MLYEVPVLTYLQRLVAQSKPYSSNTHRAMLIQTLELLGNKWCATGTYRRKKKEKLKKAMHMA